MLLVTNHESWHHDSSRFSVASAHACTGVTSLCTGIRAAGSVDMVRHIVPCSSDANYCRVRHVIPKPRVMQSRSILALLNDGTGQAQPAAGPQCQHYSRKLQWRHINGLMQKRRNSSAFNALELRLFALSHRHERRRHSMSRLPPEKTKKAMHYWHFVGDRGFPW